MKQELHRAMMQLVRWERSIIFDKQSHVSIAFHNLCALIESHSLHQLSLQVIAGLPCLYSKTLFFRTVSSGTTDTYSRNVISLLAARHMCRGARSRRRHDITSLYMWAAYLALNMGILLRTSTKINWRTTAIANICQLVLCVSWKKIMLSKMHCHLTLIVLCNDLISDSSVFLLISSLVYYIFTSYLETDRLTRYSDLTIRRSAQDYDLFD